MSSAQSGSVRGIDPKIRDAVREAAAREGVSLSEYLARALPPPQRASSGPLRPRGVRPSQAYLEDDDQDWSLSNSAYAPEPSRLAQRVEAIERRTQLAIMSLDRAVTTLDRSVLGLSARIDEAEDLTRDGADRISEALDQFRIASETVAMQLERNDAAEPRDDGAFDAAREEIEHTRERLEAQIAAAGDVARRAEAAAAYLASEIDAREAVLAKRIDALDAESSDRVAACLSEAREHANGAVRLASDAASAARGELAALEERFNHQLMEARAAMGNLVDQAVDEARSARSSLVSEIVRIDSEMAAQDAAAKQLRQAQALLAARLDSAEKRTSTAPSADGPRDAGALAARIDNETAARTAGIEDIKQAQHALAARIDKAEVNAREATAGLRQAAGAAISDLRNAQLSLSARVKSVEEAGGTASKAQIEALGAQQCDLAARLAEIEKRSGDNSSTEALVSLEERLATVAGRIAQTASAQAEADAKLEALDARTTTLAESAERVIAAEDRLAEIDGAISELSARVGAHDVQAAQVGEIGGQVQALDASLQRLAARLVEAESTANNAFRSLQEAVQGVTAHSASLEDTAHESTESLRALLEERLSDMSRSVVTMVDTARAELAERINGLDTTDVGAIDRAFEDINRRLAAAERRQAQTIEAISIEIKRMSETVDRRLRVVEDRQDKHSANGALREEIDALSRTLELRFEEIERREAAGFDRMGLEIGRVSERLEARADGVEQRSAHAIEQVGEQVARMAERFSVRQEAVQREMLERVLDGEERVGARVNEAVATMMQRLAEIEERSGEAVAPVQKAVENVATRLDRLEQSGRQSELSANDPLFGEFGALSGTWSTKPADTPVHAGPLTAPAASAPAYVAAPPAPAVSHEPSRDSVLYDDDLVVDDIDATHLAIAKDSSDPIRADAEAFGDDPFFVDDEGEPPAREAAPIEKLWTPEEAEQDIAESMFAERADDIQARKPEHEETSSPVEAPAPEPANYLQAARAAARAQSKPQRTRAAERGAPPPYSLRGSNRIVLWGAASAVAVLIAAAGWFFDQSASSGLSDDVGAEPGVGALPREAFAPFQAEPTNEDLPNGGFGKETSDLPNSMDGEGGVASEPPEPESASAPARASVAAAPLAPRTITLEQAASNGDAVAQYELALREFNSGRGDQARRLLQNAAAGGLAMAQYRLAKVYERGEGVAPDLAQARQWTERAAASGNRRAMHDLGVYFARGEGAPLDEAAAFRWFRQAAELGVADSQFNLGVLYQQGRGVSANPTEALFWFQVAARQGDGDAASRGAALEAELTPAQVEQARARAQAFRPRAASATANGQFGARPWSTPSRG